MSELKPCPFCGSNRARLVAPVDQMNLPDVRSRYVRCGDCGATGRQGFDAEIYWNTRPTQWVSVEDAADFVGWCWVKLSTGVDMTYKDSADNYRYSDMELDGYVPNDIEAVLPLPLPEPPKE